MGVSRHDAKKGRQEKNSMYLIKHGKKENQHVEYSRFNPYRGQVLGNDCTLLFFKKKILNFSLFFPKSKILKSKSFLLRKIEMTTKTN